MRRLSGALFFALFFALPFAVVACRYPALSDADLASRRLPSSEPGPCRELVTGFPATHTSAVRREPVVVVSPMLLAPRVLFRGHEGGLVSYLNFQGHPVYLVGFEAPSCDEAAASRAFAKMVREVSQRTREPVVHVVGASLGAPVVVRAVGLLADEGASPVGRVALVGAGLDYAYPGSFVARERAHLGGPAAYLCESPASCRKLSRQPEVLREHLAVLPNDAPLLFAPTSARYPGLERRREPVLFVVGKADGIAPSESSYPVFLAWGSATPDAARATKHFFLAARENGLGDDYDHAELFAGPEAEGEVFAKVAEFLEHETD